MELTACSARPQLNDIVLVQLLTLAGRLVVHCCMARAAPFVIVWLVDSGVCTVDARPQVFICAAGCCVRP